MTVEQFVTNLNNVIVNPLLALLFVIAGVVFFWGLFLFVAKADNEEERSRGTQHMIWGFVGILIMISVFGIIRLVLNTFGVDVPTEMQ